MRGDVTRALIAPRAAGSQGAFSVRRASSATCEQLSFDSVKGPSMMNVSRALRLLRMNGTS
jgi:hypothetical protein